MVNHEQFGGGDNDVLHPDFIVPADYENKIVISREDRLKGIFKTPTGKGMFLGSSGLVVPTYPYKKD